MVILYQFLTRTRFTPVQLRTSLVNAPPCNTRDGNFASEDIQITVPFLLHYADLMQLGGNTLRANLPIEPVQISPPPPIQNEAHFRSSVVNRQIVPLVRRAIHATHPERTVYDGKTWPGNTPRGKPDTSFISWDGPQGDEKEMTFPLEVKLSSNWDSAWRSTANDDPRSREYHQVLSQIHFYMDSFETRYGGILTDKELVIIERTPRFGHIRISQSIPYGEHGCFTENSGQPTVALTLWCMATRSDWFLKSNVADDPGPESDDDHVLTEM